MKDLKNFLLLFLIAGLSASAQTENTKEFHFGKNINPKSGLIIDKTTLYSDTAGYGFDLGTSANAAINEKSFTIIRPVYFSVKLPEGNYGVEVVLGGGKSQNATIKAESRRLMVLEAFTAKSETRTEKFVVNIKTESFAGEKKINLKPGEINGLNWDDKLTLEFLGSASVQSIKITPVSKIKTLYLAGDSTVTDQGSEPWGSWGQFFPYFLDTDAAVANYACSGLALSSFKSGKRLDKILHLMQPGDYLFIEFAHNDEKAKGEGKGAWGQYAALLKEFVARTREKGGIPVLITPTQRRRFGTDGKLEPTHGEFPDAMRKVANDLKVPLIDLTNMTTVIYESWGDSESKKAFVHYPMGSFPGQTQALADNTHFNSFGANEIAKCVVQGIKDLNLDIAKNIKSSVPGYNPKKPAVFKDWTVPVSASIEMVKPDGN